MDTKGTNGPGREGNRREGDGRDRIVGAFADRQCGVVSRRQLLGAGLGSQVIGGAVRAGRLRPLFRGVYAVGHTALQREAWWMAALLACGSGAILSHRSAAELWGLTRGEVFPIELIVTGSRGRKQTRIRAHEMRLRSTEAVTMNGLRVTTPARTIVDLAGSLRRRALRRLVERAQDVNRFRPAEIRAVLGSAPPRSGCRALLDLLELLQPDRDNARSHLERLFLRLVSRKRLPAPSVNVVIGEHRRDFVWPAARLVIETDGYGYHSSRRAQRRDRRRDRALIALGWRPVRFTYEEVAFEPDEVAGEVAELLGRQAPASAG